MKKQRVRELNKQFEINGWNGLINVETRDFHKFKIKDWRFPIILSAPHAINHIREGELLRADILTWWLVLYVAEKFNLPCIYSTSYLVWDPNYDDFEDSEYKQNLAAYIQEHNIQFLIDFHWCWSQRDFAIELWTWWEGYPNLLWNKKILNLILSSLEEGLHPYLQRCWKALTVDTFFPASHEGTVSRSISKRLNIPCIQFEINGELRAIEGKYLENLLIALENLVEVLENELIIWK